MSFQKFRYVCWWFEGCIRYFLCFKCLLSYFFSIQIVLSLLFMLSLFTLGSAIMGIQISHSQSNVKEIFSDTQRLTILQIEVSTKRWFSIGPRIINAADNWLKNKDDSNEVDLYVRTNTTLGNKTFEQIAKYFHSVKNIGEVHAVYYVTRTGNYVIEGRYACTSYDSFPDVCCPYTAVDLMIGIKEGLPGPVYCYSLDDQLVFGKLKIMTTRFDQRLSSWYIKTVNDNNPFTWITDLCHRNIIRTSVSRKFYDSDGVFVGTLAVFFDFKKRLERFLEDLNLDRGLLFLLQKNGYVIGTTDEEVNLCKVDEDGRSNPVHARDVQNPIIRGTFHHLIEEHCDENEDFETVDESITNDKKFKIDGVEYLLELKQFDISEEMELVLVYVTKVDDVFPSIQKGNTITIFTCISLILIFTFMSWCFVCIIMLPLRSISRKMKKVETMNNLEKIKFGRLSLFREIRIVEKRFRFCVKKLIEYSAFLPDILKTEGECLEFSTYGSSNDHDDDLSSTTTKSSSGSLDCVRSPLSPSRSVDRNNINNPTSLESIEDIKIISDFSINNNINNNNNNNKFGLGIRKKMVVVLYIYLLDWSWVFHNNSLFCAEYSKFMDFIVSLTRRFASVYSFNVDHIALYYYPSDIKQMFKHLVRISSATRSKRYGFQVIIGLSMDFSIVGVIGNKKLKMNCVSDGAVEKSRFIIDCFLESDEIQEKLEEDDVLINPCSNIDPCSILIESNIEKEIRGYFEKSEYRYIPYNIFSKVFRRNNSVEGNVIIYRVILPSLNHKSKEWMYQLHRESEEKAQKYLLNGFLSLLNHEISESREYLVKSIGSSSSSTTTISKNDQKQQQIRKIETDDDGTAVEYKSEVIKIEEKEEEDNMVINSRNLLSIIDWIEEEEEEEEEENNNINVMFEERCFGSYLEQNREEMERMKFVQFDRSVFFSCVEKLSRK